METTLQFEPHGKYHIELIDGIILCRVAGRWNLQCAENFVHEIKTMVQQLDGKPWCRIVNMLDYQLHTPEVGQYMREFGKWTVSLNCKSHCFILSDNLLAAQLDLAYKDLFPVEIYPTEAAALEHCHRKLNAAF